MSVQGLNFCPDCNNMLYPIELSEEKKLAYECKSCKHRKVVENLDRDSCCIYYQDFSQGKSSFLLDPELCLDRTLSRSYDRKCAKCGCNEAVYFQNPSQSGDVEMSLLFICCGKTPDGKLCGSSWIQGKHRVDQKQQ